MKIAESGSKTIYNKVVVVVYDKDTTKECNRRSVVVVSVSSRSSSVLDFDQWVIGNGPVSRSRNLEGLFCHNRTVSPTWKCHSRLLALCFIRFVSTLCGRCSCRVIKSANNTEYKIHGPSALERNENQYDAHIAHS